MLYVSASADGSAGRFRTEIGRSTCILCVVIQNYQLKTRAKNIAGGFRDLYLYGISGRGLNSCRQPHNIERTVEALRITAVTTCANRFISAAGLRRAGASVGRIGRVGEKKKSDGKKCNCRFKRGKFLHGKQFEYSLTNYCLPVLGNKKKDNLLIYTSTAVLSVQDKVNKTPECSGIY